MSTERTLLCADCGTEHSTIRKDTAYCPRCSMLRTMLWAAQKLRKRTCTACGDDFFPHRCPDKVKLCGTCLLTTLKHPYLVDCAVCRRQNPGPDRRIPVCFPCARDLKQRLRVIAGLQRYQSTQKAKNQWDSSPRTAPTAADTAEAP